MSLDPRFSDSMRDRLPPKHDAGWTLGISRPAAMAEPDEKAARHLDLAARQSILDEGDEARSLYLILEGAVMLSKLLPDGRRQIIELLGPGDVFGLCMNRVSDVTAETVLPSRVVIYDRSVAENSAALQRLVADRMKAQICALHDHAVLLGRKTAVERVATFLMRLVPNRGGQGCVGPMPGLRSDQASVRVSLTRQEIADYLGLTLETVSRAFSLLKRQGVLSYGRHDDVTIANVCRLCKCTGSH